MANPVKVLNDSLPTTVVLSEGERQAIISALKERVLFLRSTINTWSASCASSARDVVTTALVNLRDTRAALDVFAQDEKEARI